MFQRRTLAAILLVALAVAGMTGCFRDDPQQPILTTSQSQPDATQSGQIVPGEYIVVAKARPGGGPQGAPAMETLQIARDVKARPRHVYHTVLNGFSARLTDDQVTALRNDPRVAYVEPNRTVHMVGQTVPWGITHVNAPTAHANGITGTGVKVGIIDTGIDYTHPDLAANYAGGTDFANNDNDPMDDNGHGTHVSGTVAAIDNTIGVLGVAPDVRLYGIKVLDRNGSGTFADVIAGIDWAAANGMQVINMSLGASVGSAGLQQACDNAYAAGVVICAAAGNDYGGPVNYPAKYSSVIAVSAIDSSDKLAFFSNQGPEVELAAPGVSVYSTYRGGGYATLDGTSMATPHVTGVAALVWASGVANTATGVRDRLDQTARDIGAAGRDNSFGFGVVDAAAATAGGGGGGGNQPPVANANGPYSGTAGSAVNFSSAGSNDPDGTIVSYAWDFGDGATSSQANPSHTYASAGTYTVTLTVTDDQGATATDQTTASITSGGGGGGGDTVTITKAQYDPNKQKLTVEAVSTDPSATLTVVGYGTMQYDSRKGIWKFKKQPVSPCPGTVTVTSDLGGSDTSPVSGCSGGGQNQPPVANANGPYSGTAGSAVNFSSAGSNDPDGTIVSYAWDFGDGATSSQANPSHTYASAGTYTVTLTVTDDQGATATDQTTASITSGGGGGGGDTVTITKAEWSSSKKELKVEAVSTDPSATLTVVGWGTMQYDSEKGIWKFRQKNVSSPPSTVTVTSDLGGSDTSPVTIK